jgi:hypothetical protein
VHVDQALRRSSALRDELLRAVKAYLDSAAALLRDSEAFVDDLAARNLLRAEVVAGAGARLDQMKAELREVHRLLRHAPADMIQPARPGAVRAGAQTTQTHTRT